MNVYVVRHGQTIVNVREQINGHNTTDLTEEGKLQAEIAAQAIKNIKLDMIYCSPLRRTRQTADIISGHNSAIIYDKRLIERDANSMQYLPVSALDKNLWFSLENDVPYSDAESFRSVLIRVSSFLNEIRHEKNYNNILLVTHGDVCKAIKVYFDGINDNIADFGQKNCEIVKYVL